MTARLTSHFANNKVTLFDFELAENMNKCYKGAKKHNLYPFYTSSQFLTAALGAGSLIVLLGAYQTLKQNRFITDIALLVNTDYPTGPVAGESEENHSAW